jgi:hypothetical protein
MHFDVHSPSRINKTTKLHGSNAYLRHKKEDMHTHEGLSKIFRIDGVKIIKLTIRPIGCHHPGSSSLPHVDTCPTVSTIFGTLPGSPFL